MLQVLMDSEDGISREALKTLTHFLQAHDEEMDSESEAPPQLKQAIEIVEKTSNKIGFRLSISPSVVWKTTKAAVSEAQKLISRSGRPAEDVDDDVSEVSSGGCKVENKELEFPPSRKEIAARMEELELELKEFEDSVSLVEGHDLSPRAYTDFLISEHMHSERTDDDLMQQIMGIQGALSALVSKLAEAASDVQLDVIATISKILRNNRRNQREFRDINGYTFMTKILNGINDYKSPAGQLFLKVNVADI